MKRWLAALVLALASCSDASTGHGPFGVVADPTAGTTGGSAAGSGGASGVGATGGSDGAAGTMMTGGQGGAGTAGVAGAPMAGAMATGGTMSEPVDAGEPIDADTMEPTEGPELGTVEDSGADCVVPALPSASALTPYDKHHDPFVMLDGSRITKKAQWRCRRAEIKAQLEQYESGPKPVVAPEDVNAALSGNRLTITVRSGAKSVDFTVTINRPASASGAAPLVIEYFFETLDKSVFSSNGVATIVYDNDELGAESGGSSRGTGVFYDLYGRDHPASSMVAWAWGVSRILDALEQTPEAMIDPDRVAVTGCSRYGKGALLAGALDERIVLTIPQESGAGGSASWRVSQAQSAAGENVQTLSNAAGEQPWFRQDFGATFGGSNVTKLPFDHHMVMGLVAPRALLVIDNPIDWLGIDSTYTAGSIAHAIWQAYGVPDRMGYWQSTGHTHCQFPAAQREVLEAYVKKFLVGTTAGDTNVLRAESAEADLGRWMDWTPPALE